jgi:hypothetical protein
MRLFLLALCLAPIAVLVPILEVGPTHVFNPDWPGHARLHEVWQLIGNTALCFFSFWLAWQRRDWVLACILGLIPCLGFLTALGLAPLYGGTMRHSDGTELAIGGVNVAVIVVALSTSGLVALLSAVLRERRNSNGEGISRL